MNKIIQEILDKNEEYLEMVEVPIASTAIIDVLCRLLDKERNDKEYYKALYTRYANLSISINS